MLIDVSGFFGPTFDVDTIGTNLNDAGEEGWELVSIVDVNNGRGATGQLIANLKRPRHS